MKQEIPKIPCGVRRKYSTILFVPLRFTMLTALLLCTAAATTAATDEKTSAELAFERFKAMEGTWTGAAADGRKITNTFEVISRGRS